MHSLVARLRGRAVSQATTATTESDDAVASRPHTPASFPVFSASQTVLEHTPVGQRILPEIQQLMDSFSAVDLSEQGLSPPPIRRRSSSSPSPISPIDLGPSALPQHELSRSSSPTAHSECSSLRESKTNFSRFSRRLATSSVWSTFGRHNAGVSPRSSRAERDSTWTGMTFGSVDTLGVPRRSDLSGPAGTRTIRSSVVSDGRPSYTSESSMPLQAAPLSSSFYRRSTSRVSTLDEQADEQADEQTDQRSPSPATISSRQDSTKRSPTIASSLSSHSSAPAVHTPLIDMPSSSPRTFGQTSPPLLSAFTPSPSTSVSASPRPPMPPLDHPELVACMASRSQPVFRNLSNTASPPLRHYDSDLYPKTYPPRRRRKTEGTSPDENSVPFPSATSRRSLRAYASLPKVRQLFQSERHKRGKSYKSSPSRRFSAEWNAKQATSGVLASNPGRDFGWPAEVSNEILRMSLGDETIGKPRGIKTAAASPEGPKPDIIHRVQNVPAGSGEPGGHCSPLLSPHSEPTPPETAAEGGDERPSTPPNGGNSPSQKPAGVVEVKRGMSAGELSTLEEGVDRELQSVALPRPPGPRTPRKSILRHSYTGTQSQDDGPSQQQNAPSTPPRRSSGRHPVRQSSEPVLPSVMETPTNNKGKRKAEDIDITPLDQRQQHTTFLIPIDKRRARLVSEESGSPSAYQQRKRVRLSSTPSPAHTPGHSRPSSAHNAPNMGSIADRTNFPVSPAVRALSRAGSTHDGSTRSLRQSIVSSLAPSAADSRRGSRRTLSQTSIPVTAVVAPHPPSLDRSSVYHMRDPRRPPRIRQTPWIPRLRSADEEGSPLHAWTFFVGFVLFPIWWIASFLPIPETRRVGYTDTEKGVTLDDPQVEHDARSWRLRCRIMSAISLFTYIPFIVLVAIFAPR